MIRSYILGTLGIAVALSLFVISPPALADPECSDARMDDILVRVSHIPARGAAREKVERLVYQAKEAKEAGKKKKCGKKLEVAEKLLIKLGR